MSSLIVWLQCLGVFQVIDLLLNSYSTLVSKGGHDVRMTGFSLCKKGSYRPFFTVLADGFFDRLRQIELFHHEAAR